MPPSRSADLSARIAVLGIVVQEDGPVTLGNVSLRFAEDFGVAQFSKSAVHQNLRNLTERGYLRLVSEGAEPSFNVYEALADGVEEFEEWLTASEPDPPALRDALQARLSFYARRAKRGDIAAQVEKLRLQQKRCSRQFAIAHGNLRLDQEQQKHSPGTLSDAVRLIRLEDETELWGREVTRLRRRRERLEIVLAESRDVGA